MCPQYQSASKLIFISNYQHDSYNCICNCNCKSFEFVVIIEIEISIVIVIENSNAFKFLVVIGIIINLNTTGEIRTELITTTELVSNQRSQ